MGGRSPPTLSECVKSAGLQTLDQMTPQGVALVCFLCALINIDKRFDAIAYKYEIIVQMVDSYDGQDYGNMGSLVEAVVGMNNAIATHKAHHDSKWMGLWYSEKIANLEPITFDKKVQDIPALE